MNINNQRDVEFGHLFDILFNMTANEVAVYGSLIGFLLSQDLTQQEQGALGNFLMLVAQVMVSMGAQNNLVTARQQARIDDTGYWGHA